MYLDEDFHSTEQALIVFGEQSFQRESSHVSTALAQSPTSSSFAWVADERKFSPRIQRRLQLSVQKSSTACSCLSSPHCKTMIVESAELHTIARLTLFCPTGVNAPPRSQTCGPLFRGQAMIQMRRYCGPYLLN